MCNLRSGSCGHELMMDPRVIASERCPIDDHVMLRARHDWLLCCPHCGLERSTLEPDIESGALSHGIEEQSRQAGLDAVRTINADRLLSVIARYASGSRLLDVGSGPGFFLALAERSGFDATGVEPDRRMADNSRASEMRVYSGFFPGVLPDDAMFDVIVLNDVLEHIPDLDGVFAGFQKHLADDGLLILNCPDRNGILYRIATWLDRLGVRGPYNRMWQMGLPSPHVWYFTRQQLREISEARGFSFVSNVHLVTLSRKGLLDRISYVKNQSKSYNFLVYALIWSIVPILRFFPSDVGAIAARKKPSTN
jgi:SAM-dependent methyltransferase